MPSGPKKRKAAKKKQVKHSHNSISSSTAHSHHGESDGGELISPAAQDEHNHRHLVPEGEMEKLEGSSQNTSITTGSTDKAGKEEEGDTEIDKGSKLRKPHDNSSSSSNSSSGDESHVIGKKVAALESAAVAELVQPIESLPEKTAHKVEDLAVDISSVHPVKPPESQVYDDTKIEDENYVVVEDTGSVSELDKSLFLEQTFVVNGSATKANCSTSLVVESVFEENGEAKLPSPDENASSESKDNVAASSNPTSLVSRVNYADRVNEPKTSQYLDKPPLVASVPRGTVQTTSWKSCCGILELFSSSDR